MKLRGGFMNSVKNLWKGWRKSMWICSEKSCGEVDGVRTSVENRWSEVNFPRVFHDDFHVVNTSYKREFSTLSTIPTTTTNNN